MKKVLIASYNLGYGGIETSLINLLKNIDLKKFKVTLILEKKEGVFLSDVPKGIKIKEYKVSNNKNKFIRKSINLLKRIKWLLFNYKRYDSSVCYATYSGPCSFVARTSSNNKIMFVHNDYYEIYKEDKKITIDFFGNLKINDYNHIVFVSNESREKIQKLFPKLSNKMTTINNLIDHERIINLSKELVIKKPKNKKIFLFIGRLDEEQKKVSRIIDVANLFKDNEKVEFWLLGDGDYRKEYEEKIKKYNLSNVKMLGAKKNPYPYIKACDAILLTSDYEGFPVVYNEAIILNKPIITTVCVSDEIINIEDGFGIICDRKIDSISNAINKFLKDDFKINKKIDFSLVNKNRVDMITKLLEDTND